MSLSAPLDESYLNKCKLPQKHEHQTLIYTHLNNCIWPPNIYNNPYLYLSYSTAKNINNNKQEKWDDLFTATQSIDYEICNNTTGNLATTFLNTAGEANKYVWFGYVPQTIFYHTRGQVSGSINYDPVNTKKRLKTNKGSLGHWTWRILYIN